jgi:hypothetical protein
MVHYRSHKRPPPVSILSQLDPVHPPHPTSWRSILILSSHLRLGLPSDLFPSGFPTNTLYMPLLSPHTRYMPYHFILLDFITHTKLGEEYKFTLQYTTIHYNTANISLFFFSLSNLINKTYIKCKLLLDLNKYATKT